MPLNDYVNVQVPPPHPSFDGEQLRHAAYALDRLNEFLDSRIQYNRDLMRMNLRKFLFTLWHHRIISTDMKERLKVSPDNYFQGFKMGVTYISPKEVIALGLFGIDSIRGLPEGLEKDIVRVMKYEPNDTEKSPSLVALEGADGSSGTPVHDGDE